MNTVPSLSAALPELLLLDNGVSIAGSVPHLRESFRVTIPPSIDSAIEYLRRSPIRPEILITEVTLNGRETFPVIAAAKQLRHPPAVLITTATVDRVPDALVAGCDAVLLKPFARNLLFARLGRLQREREREKRQPRSAD